MKFKRLSVLFVFALVLNTIFSSFAFAETNAKLNLVALGDSITFGWNLDKVNDPTNSHPHPGAFPYLIGNGEYTVAKNISGGGWTTQSLLNQLADPANMAVIQSANLITLDIGNNDLLQNTDIKAVLSTPSPTQDQIAAAISAAQATAGEIGKNLTAIIGIIKQANPNATIILYNLYDPFGSTTQTLHNLAEQIIPSINSQVILPIAQKTGSQLADAYTAFNGHQAEYILPGDIHPTAYGQQVLAGLANNILEQLQPLTIDLTPSTTDKTTSPVTITVTTNAKETVQMKWLPGEKTADDFYADPSVNNINDNKFEVTANGKYTVYVMDSREKEAVKVIDIENIAKDVPSNPGNGSQAPSSGDTATQQPAPTPVPTASAPTSNTGHALPETAASTYNYLVFGLAVVLAGLAMMRFQNRKREN